MARTKRIPVLVDGKEDKEITKVTKLLKSSKAEAYRYCVHFYLVNRGVTVNSENITAVMNRVKRKIQDNKK